MLNEKMKKTHRSSEDVLNEKKKDDTGRVSRCIAVKRSFKKSFMSFR